MNKQNAIGKIDKGLALLLGLMTLSVCVSPILGRNVFWVIFALFIIRIILKPSVLQPLLEIKGFMYVAGAIIFTVLAQAVYGGRFFEVIRNGDYLFQISCLIPAIVFLTVKEKNYLTKLFDFLAAGATIVSINLIWRGLWHSGKLQFVNKRIIDSLMGHVLNTSVMFICLIPLMIVLGANEKTSHRHRYIYYFCAGLCLLASILTGARGYYISILAEGLFLLMFMFRHQLKKLIAVFSVMIVLFGASYAFIPVFQQRVSSIGDLKDNAQYQRILMWQSAIDMWKDYPLLGVGMGNYADKFNEEYIYPDTKKSKIIYWHAHNCYFHLLAEDGLFGFFMYMFAYGYILIWGWKRRYNKYGESVFVTTLGLLIYSATDYVLFHGTTGMRLYWLMLGLCIKGVWFDEQNQVRQIDT